MFCIFDNGTGQKETLYALKDKGIAAQWIQHTRSAANRTYSKGMSQYVPDDEDCDWSEEECA